MPPTAPAPDRRAPPPPLESTTRPSLQWVLDAITAGRPSSATAAWTCSPPTSSAAPSTPTSTPTRAGRRTSPGSRSSTPPRERFYPDWDSAADICVAILRTEAGRDPHDNDLHDLVGELSTRSDDFRTRWGSHNVRHHGTGTKHFHHPVVGDLTLAYEGLDMAAEPGLTLTIYTAEPGSPSAERLRLLGSWAATQRQRPRRTGPHARPS